jgi:F-type H+-transporting ATPase subunit alpha
MTRGYGRGVPINKVQEYEANLLQFMKSSHPEVVQAIANEKAITEQTEPSLRAALAEFNQSAGYGIPK